MTAFPGRSESSEYSPTLNNNGSDLRQLRSKPPGFMQSWTSTYSVIAVRMMLDTAYVLREDRT